MVDRILRRSGRLVVPRDKLSVQFVFGATYENLQKEKSDNYGYII